MTKAFKARASVIGFGCLWLGALLAGSCGGQEPIERRPSAPEEDASVNAPCEAVMGAECGVVCDDDNPCPKGLHCVSGECTAECSADADCAVGKCSADGRCVERKDDQPMIEVRPPDLDASVGETDGAPKCIEGQVEFTPVVPQVWLLLDRSGSMSSSLGTTSRWAALGAVIVGDPAVPDDRGVVGAFEERAAFGAVFYTDSYSSTCVLALESIAPAANNYAKIRQRYNKLAPTGGTPTADAIAATVAEAAAKDLTGGPKILVLATDGEPTPCAPRQQAAAAEVEAEVARAYSKGIRTFAVSIASETNPVHMQRVANLGVGLPVNASPPAPYYTAATQDELKLAFSTILEDVPRSCVFSLNGTVEKGKADRGTVKLAGVDLVYGDEDGWALKQPDQVELLGKACEQIQAGEEDLDISFPCEVFKPVQ